MRRWLEHHRYALAVTLRRLAIQPFSFLSNLAVLSLVLALPLLGASVLVSVQPLSKEISATPALTVYMEPDATSEQAEEVNERILKAQDPAIESVVLVDKNAAIQDLQRNEAWHQALEALGENPLPDAIVVHLKTDDNLTQIADGLARQWRTWDNVALVQLDSIWVQRLEALLRLGRIGLLLITLIVALVVLTAVFNTVRMQALSQRDEIAVARLVGATEGFVRRPFLYQGAFTCALATLVAMLWTQMFLGPLNSAIGGLARTYDAFFVLQMPSGPLLLVYLFCASLIGAFSARWSVTRTTRF
ncbi:cell division protein FtsX [Orrella marina]|uniref:Cell division protein FtsX n=1 Tax=Orrella marina TaxID=2163011 RepID=A0A2R4XMR4_9BURK|nr:permease-like cell division protein FtsX [Orrella marina]AWB35078.1 permease [Orrella marina]